MAKLTSRIILEVDSFFKRTRITRCVNRSCRFLMRDEIQCTFKEIELDENGYCRHSETMDKQQKGD